jgi:hypothetical protein
MSASYLDVWNLLVYNLRKFRLHDISYREEEQMTDDIDKKMKKIMDDIDGDMGYTADDSDIQQGKESRSRKKIFIIGGVVFIVFIVLVLILPRGNNMIFNSQLNSINTRLTQFEEKLTVFENMKERVSLLEKQQKVLQQLVLETGRSARSAKSEIDRLAEKIEILEKKKVSSAGKTGKSRASKQQREQTSSTKKRYHIIRKGENLYRISLRYGIPVEKLCRLNGITSGQVIVPGKKLLVPPGKNQ